jgi:antitoxin (DNA-binding transcriptional repressor) of toxin-antitoxin stability system
MATFHISETEAGHNFADLMARVRAGAEVVIEDGSSPVAVIRSANPPKGRLLSESLALAKARTKERGYEAVMDEDFAADMREIIAKRKPRDTSAWDD